MYHKNVNLIFIFFFVISYTSWVYALSDDSSQPINIKADTAEINDATGISIYLGNVVITQGSMKLTGDKVTLEVADKKVQKITSEGNLATFEQTTDEGKDVYAEAEILVYNIRENKIVLTENAKLTESGNTFTSNHIVIYTDKEIVSAGSSTGNDRVNITVFPETIKTEDRE